MFLEFFESKEHLTATENLATLYKLRVDETKTALDFEEKSENRKNDKRGNRL